MTKRKKKSAPARPPLAAQLKQGARRLAKFTGDNSEPRRKKLQLAAPPCVAIGIGRLTMIEYETTIDGLAVTMHHKFNRRSAPTLAASADGARLMLFGGDYRFTGRGVVDRRK